MREVLFVFRSRSLEGSAVCGIPFRHASALGRKQGLWAKNRIGRSPWPLPLACCSCYDVISIRVRCEAKFLNLSLTFTRVNLTRGVNLTAPAARGLNLT